MAVKHATITLTTIPAEPPTKNMHILRDKLATEELLKGHLEAALCASLSVARSGASSQSVTINHG